MSDEPQIGDPLKQNPPPPPLDPLLKSAYASSHPTRKIRESFNWLVPEILDSVPVGKKQVRVKVVAARVGDISLNNRKYVKEELPTLAGSLIGKKVCVNHNLDHVIGDIHYATVEGENLEALLNIKSAMYAKRLKEHDANHRGWSVGAQYHYAKCPICEARIRGEKQVRHHMKEVHQLTNYNWEPRGIIGDEISYVEYPEEPGLKTSTQIVETVDGLNRLFETVTQDLDALSQATEYMPGAKPLERGGTTDLLTKDLPRFPPLIDWYGKWPSLAACVAANPDKPDPTAYCMSIHGKDLHEWYGQWDSLDDCLRANSDKADPNAYCMSIHGEGESREVWTQQQLTIIEGMPDGPEKTAFDSLLAVADSTVDGTQQEAEVLKQEIAALQAQLTREQEQLDALTVKHDQAVTETVNQVKAAEEKAENEYKLRVLAENALDRVKGKFKGKAQQVKVTEDEPMIGDPLKMRPNK